MPGVHGTTQKRTLQILEDLEAVRENLLELSGEIWGNIDHNDTEAMDQGVQFKRAYNEKSRAFDKVAAPSAKPSSILRLWARNCG